MGAEALHERLRDLDPETAAKVPPSNTRRVVRALEVITLTGKPFTASLPERSYVYDDVVQVGVRIPRPVLDDRIDRRVRRMWDAGLVDEVRRLAAHGLREGRTANRALGYRQVLAHLDGELTEDRGVRADRDGHPALRPAPGRLVRQGLRASRGWTGTTPHRVERAVEACRPG